MPHIAIPIPSGPGKQEIEIEMTINGKHQEVHYRVELFYWSDCEIHTRELTGFVHKFSNK